MKPIALLTDAQDNHLDDFASQVRDEIVSDALVRKYRTSGGCILVTLWRGAVHEVCYQLPERFFWRRLKRNRALLKFYGQGQAWSQDWPIDFGWSKAREDGTARALYASGLDYLTFVSSEFDSVRSELRFPDALTVTASPDNEKSPPG